MATATARAKRRDGRTGTVRSRLKWVALVTAVPLVLTACGTVPGAAATIDGTQVSTEALLTRVTDVIGTTAAADEAASAAQARTQLTTIIRHQLAEAAAKKNHFEVTDADVNGFIAQYDAYQKQSGAPAMSTTLGVPAADVAATSYDLLVFDKLMNAIPTDGTPVTDVEVTVDAVPAATWAEAVALRTKYEADPAALDAAAKAALAADPQLPGGQESLLEQPQHAVFGIFSAAEGQILLVPNGSAGYLVVRVSHRVQKQQKLTAQMISNANQNAGLAAEIAIASLLLGSEAQAAHIRVNPRFGTWDPQVVQVVASES